MDLCDGCVGVQVNACDWSSNGQSIIAGLDDGEVMVFEASGKDTTGVKFEKAHSAAVRERVK